MSSSSSSSSLVEAAASSSSPITIDPPAMFEVPASPSELLEGIQVPSAVSASVEKLSPFGLAYNLQRFDSFEGNRPDGVPEKECMGNYHAPFGHNYVTIPSGVYLEGSSSFSSTFPSSSSSSLSFSASSLTSSSTPSIPSHIGIERDEKQEEKVEDESFEESAVGGDDSGVLEVKVGMSVIKRECFVQKIEGKKVSYECKECGEKIESKQHLVDYFKHFERVHRKKFENFDKRFYEGVARETARFCLKALQSGGSEEVVRILTERSELTGGKFKVKQQLGGEKKERKKKNEKKEVKEEKKENEKKKEKRERKEKEEMKEEEDIIDVEKEERVKVVRSALSESAAKSMKQLGYKRIEKREKEELHGVSGTVSNIDGAVQVVLSDGEIDEATLHELRFVFFFSFFILKSFFFFLGTSKRRWQNFRD